MFVTSPSKALLLVTFSLVITISSHITSADPGCRTDSDCGAAGNGFRCDTESGDCECGNGKKFVSIPSASPQCQPLAEIGQACAYNEQCNSHNAAGGLLSRCNNKKCECYDTEFEGRDKIRAYKGTCYRATTVGESCLHRDQCKASIEPEDNVDCVVDPKTHRHVCQCLAGKHCDEKTDTNGAGTTVQFGAASLVTFTVLGLMAVKVVQ